ncbi:tRNA lysidine(34) synthetase TilS [Verrucomicrobia bacterium]|jgi:tRNA(Ile)-lysidine synthase|nr:tRNA lysidine(34) synthetase TilS [Verrucomicrobiota bacterium]
MERVEEALVASERVLPGEGILVAVSGGVDSMVLLEVLHRLVGANRWELTVAHFNHLLRGQESDRDEAFVRSVAASFGMPVVVGRGDVAMLGVSHQVSLEMAAREARHCFFVREAKERGIQKVLLAHHADDQAELFFLRLFRGAGSDGLGGMKKVSVSPFSESVQLIRPLLESSKRELLAFAKAEGIEFREDGSNRDSDILRNRVRNQLLPLLQEEYSGAIVATVARSMSVLSAEHDFIEAEAKRWLQDVKIERSVKSFDLLAVALQREVLRLGLLAIQVVPEFWMIESLREPGMEPVITVAGGRRVARSQNGCLSELLEGELAFNEEARSVDLSAGKQSVWFGGLHLCLEFVERRDGAIPVAATDGEEFFDADCVGGIIQLRHWRRGDRFQPIGMANSVKLQDWFTNQKVPAATRRLLILAEASDGSLFWVEGLRIGERFKVSETTKRVLKIAWEREVAI